MKISTIVLPAIGGVSTNQVGRSALSSNTEFRRKLIAAHQSNFNRNLAVSAECATGIDELAQDATLAAAFDEAFRSQCPNASTETDTSIIYDYVAGCPDSVKSDLQDTCEEAGGSFTEPVTLRIACSLDGESFEVVTTVNECLHPSCDFDNYLDQLDDLNDDPEMQQLMNELEALGMTCTFSNQHIDPIPTGNFAVSAECATGMDELNQNAALIAAYEGLDSQCPNASMETDNSIIRDYVAGCPDSVKSDLKDTCEEAGGSFTDPMSARFACSLGSESFELIITMNECLHPSCDADNYLIDQFDDPEMQQFIEELEASGMACTFSSSSAPPGTTTSQATTTAAPPSTTSGTEATTTSATAPPGTTTSQATTTAARPSTTSGTEATTTSATAPPGTTTSQATTTAAPPSTTSGTEATTTSATAPPGTTTSQATTTAAPPSTTSGTEATTTSATARTQVNQKIGAGILAVATVAAASLL